MCSINQYFTHYYEGEIIQIKNICDSDDVEAQAILTSLFESGQRTGLHSGYLQERREVEAWLYHEFVRKGKTPYLRHPLYFVLAEHDDLFQKGGFLTSTHPNQLKVPYLKPFHGQVFTKDEITEIIQTYGLPGNRWKTEEAWRYNRFIEAQIWDIRPIKKFLES